MISIYIAARFPEKPAARDIRERFQKEGFLVTSRWLEEETALDEDVSWEERRYFANLDMLDVKRAQALVLWNPQTSGKIGTGGCHVEVGMALAWGMPVCVLGEPSNVFHYLDAVFHSRTVRHAIQGIRKRVMVLGPGPRPCARCSGKQRIQVDKGDWETCPVCNVRPSTDGYCNKCDEPSARLNDERLCPRCARPMLSEPAPSRNEHPDNCKCWSCTIGK